MIITSDKIEVTYQMMSDNNMIKIDQIGVPVNPADPSKGLSWKSFWDLNDNDFDAIEAYFINKRDNNNSEE